MAAKIGLIISGVVGIVAVSSAGYFVNEWQTCRNMEQSFFATIDTYSRSVEAEALASSVGVQVDPRRRKELQDLSLQIQQVQLAGIYDRCGNDMGNAAAELATDELRESMRDVLSMP